jgi:hypothetical protein
MSRSGHRRTLLGLVGLMALAVVAPADARGRSCGAHHRSCGGAEYCQFSPGSCHAARATGVCRAKPQVCPDVFITVCGCDGKVYANTCQANRAGVSVAHLGYCGKMPGPGGGAPIAPPASNAAR